MSMRGPWKPQDPPGPIPPCSPPSITHGATLEVIPVQPPGPSPCHHHLAQQGPCSHGYPPPGHFPEGVRMSSQIQIRLCLSSTHRPPTVIPSLQSPADCLTSSPFSDPLSHSLRLLLELPGLIPAPRAFECSVLSAWNPLPFSCALPQPHCLQGCLPFLLQGSHLLREDLPDSCI